MGHIRRQTPFTPSNRSTPLVLRHWKPVPPPASIIQADPDHPKGSQTQLQDDGKSAVDQTIIATTTTQEPDPFEVFGREGNGPNVMTYSQTEYEAWLTGESSSGPCVSLLSNPVCVGCRADTVSSTLIRPLNIGHSRIPRPPLHLPGPDMKRHHDGPRR